MYGTGAIVDRWTSRKTDCQGYYCAYISSNGLHIKRKAVGRAYQTFAYSGRLEHDWLFAHDHRLAHGIWHHAAQTTKYEYVSKIFEDFMSSSSLNSQSPDS
jgi:hypothetical protein